MVEILDIKDAVKFFNGRISEWLIREAVNRKILPHIRIGKGRGRILFNKRDLEIWIAEQMRLSVEPEPKKFKLAK